MTVVMPRGKAEPEGGKQTTDATEQLSVAVGAEKVIAAERWPISAVAVMFAGQMIVGGVASVTVTVAMQVA
jgi:hypothetical protein